MCLRYPVISFLFFFPSLSYGPDRRVSIHLLGLKAIHEMNIELPGQPLKIANSIILFFLSHEWGWN